MEPTRRFTLLTFPQGFDGQVLRVNAVFLPRNQNPLTAATDAVPNVRPFADAALSFVARVIPGLSGLPSPAAALAPIALPIAVPPSPRAIFELLANRFTIGNKTVVNSDANLDHPLERAPDPVALQASVMKYLPQSYRHAFNFVAPRTPNAVIDDAYHCALRDAKPVAGFVPSPEAITWGEVFAHAMRQPLLAQALGMIYETELTVDATHFPKGGWLYLDLADDSDYRTELDNDAVFVRRYAARIPPLAPGTPREVFAAIQFPVRAVAAPGNYDDLFVEAAEYDEGFAKVVHAVQPVSANLLLEESDGAHPTKDAGVRLGWDDEQILIWYIRQLTADESVGPNQRIDAPIGVSGYRIDVRRKHTPDLPWDSLNLVSSVEPLSVSDPVTEDEIVLGDFLDRELPYQVYPARLDGDAAKPYWLPMYFAAWNGRSMVLPDTDAARIYRHDKVKARPEIHVTNPPANDLAKRYEPAPIAAPLEYGKVYEFRIRLGDLSGGGPAPGKDPAHLLRPQVGTCHFKRYVAPAALRIAGLSVNNDDLLFAGDELKLTRPLLGYPAVVYTGGYADPITELVNASVAMTGKEAFGIPDPDVARVEITVELQTLKMDNLMSVSGRESYVKFYTTTRAFPAASPVFADVLTIPLEFRDAHVLNFGDAADLGDLGATQAELDALDALILPRARVVRLTLRAVCEERAGYYGLEKDDHEFNTRFGRTVQFQVYRPSEDEAGLFAETTRPEMIRGIYLQPDPPRLYDGNPASLLLGKDVERPPEIVQRLAQEIGLAQNGLTLTGRPGERVQFGCSHRIRHTLSPDNSSLTFASKGDLTNHWLCAITLTIDRDWTWDGLQDRSLVIERTKRFREDDAATESETGEVGDIEIKRTVPFTALQKPQRNHTRVVFIDAVETKAVLKRPAPHDQEARFPDLISLEYTVRAQFKPGHGAENDGDLSLPMLLPITTPPAQVPRIVSAGLALSPYKRNESYSETEPRRRVLWLEFAEPILDSKDTYFARILAYAPDQLISHNHPELLVAPEEPPLAISAEPIRTVMPDQSNDNAGLDAMLPMEPSTDRDRFFLVPLPDALHHESPEMFGFFTYEICVGHYKYTDTTAHHQAGDYVWTTARGRYGRPIRVTGLQHPAPTLTCTADRDEDKLYVTAPYAVAVHNGRNVTATPPRTEIWCLLYAQVVQADHRDFRNILLDDRPLDPALRVEHEKDVNWSLRYTDAQITTLKKATIRNFRDDVSYAKARQLYKLADPASVNKDATKYGTAVWSNSEVSQMLAQYGLPTDASLSVLCVEILPHITSIYEHVSRFDDDEVRSIIRGRVGDTTVLPEHEVRASLASRVVASRSVDVAGPRPLSDHLGHYRILRTSPLVAVPFVCCPDC